MAGAESAIPLLIAMKGHPGTGKTTVSRSLASLLRIPLIDKDDVKDATFAVQLEAAILNDLSYDVIFKIAATQLQSGLSVIVDSPLSRRAHFERLVEIASCRGACLLVLECRTLDQHVWRERLERRGRGDMDGASWHKPATWDDLQRLLEKYEGCTEYDTGNVPKFVVDTSAGDVRATLSSVVNIVNLVLMTEFPNMPLLVKKKNL